MVIVGGRWFCWQEAIGTILRIAVPAVGMRIIRFRMRIRIQHKITLGQFRSTVASYLGIAKHANAFNFQESLRLKYLTKECKYAKQIDELASRI